MEEKNKVILLILNSMSVLLLILTIIIPIFEPYYTGIIEILLQGPTFDYSLVINLVIEIIIFLTIFQLINFINKIRNTILLNKKLLLILKMSIIAITIYISYRFIYDLFYRIVLYSDFAYHFSFAFIFSLIAELLLIYSYYLINYRFSEELKDNELLIQEECIICNSRDDVYMIDYKRFRSGKFLLDLASSLYFKHYIANFDVIHKTSIPICHKCNKKKNTIYLIKWLFKAYFYVAILNFINFLIINIFMVGSFSENYVENYVGFFILEISIYYVLIFIVRTNSYELRNSVKFKEKTVNIYSRKRGTWIYLSEYKRLSNNRLISGNDEKTVIFPKRWKKVWVLQKIGALILIFVIFYPLSILDLFYPGGTFFSIHFLNSLVIHTNLVSMSISTTIFSSSQGIPNVIYSVIVLIIGYFLLKNGTLIKKSENSIKYVENYSLGYAILAIIITLMWTGFDFTNILSFPRIMVFIGSSMIILGYTLAHKESFYESNVQEDYIIATSSIVSNDITNISTPNQSLYRENPQAINAQVDNYCGNCGHKNVSNDLYCTNCGTSLR